MSREAVRKIFSVFRELYVNVVAQNEDLKDKVRRLEREAEQNHKTQTRAATGSRMVPKIKPSGEN